MFAREGGRTEPTNLTIQQNQKERILNSSKKIVAVRCRTIKNVRTTDTSFDGTIQDSDRPHQ